MNELFNLPFDPFFAQMALFIGALIINISGVFLLAAALIRFVLKPGTARISARRCLIIGLVILLVGIICMIPALANMQTMTDALKNIRR